MSESRVATIWLALMLTLLISSTLGQVTECTSSPKLRFVAQLSINGCPIFVHKAGLEDSWYTHLAVEPLMCVMQQSLNAVLPQYDQVIQQTYVSVPVVLRDDAILKEVERQLRHLSPKSVKFATVSDISVSDDTSSRIQALGFDWSPDEPSGVIRFACDEMTGDWCKTSTGINEKLSALLSYHVTATAVLEANGIRQSHRYQVVMQNHSFFHQNISSQRYSSFAACHQLRFIRSIDLNSCLVRVHERQGVQKRHFLIEPLLCHNFTSVNNKSIMYDYSRDMYYLKLDIFLQDDGSLDVIRSKLADLAPLNVTFMRLWRAESVVASALSRRFEIGGLMVSGDWRSGQMRVYCRTVDECYHLKSSVTEPTSDLWRHNKWTVSSILPEGEIFCSSVVTRNPYLTKTDTSQELSPNASVSVILSTLCPELQPTTCKYLVERNDTGYVVIQQRLTGNVSFQRGWSEYEAGFGDDTDFWIGLSTIHALSINGATLRVEMKLWNGTELHAEYAHFKVGDASTNYTLMIGYFNTDRSSPGLTDWGMGYHRENQFSTLDRRSTSAAPWCFTNSRIKNGWWIGYCVAFNPNGYYGGGTDFADMIWFDTANGRLPLREVRMLLQSG